jgi:hypothetical protein
MQARFTLPLHEDMLPPKGIISAHKIAEGCTTFEEVIEVVIAQLSVFAGRTNAARFIFPVSRLVIFTYNSFATAGIRE